MLKKRIQELLIEREENNKEYEELRKQIQEEEEKKKSEYRRIRKYNNNDAEPMYSDSGFPPLERPKLVDTGVKEINNIKISSSKTNKTVRYDNKNVYRESRVDTTCIE